MRIESEIKLDYSDVLLRPKRSTLESRKEVDLVREFTFPNAGGEGSDPKAYGWKGIPIVASNMDTVGTFEMAKALAQYRMLTCISKHNDGDIWAHKLNGYGVWKQKNSEKLTKKIGSMTVTLDIGRIEFTNTFLPPSGLNMIQRKQTT